MKYSGLQGPGPGLSGPARSQTDILRTNRKVSPAVWPQWWSRTPGPLWFLSSDWLRSSESGCELPPVKQSESLWGTAWSWCRCCTWKGWRHGRNRCVRRIFTVQPVWERFELTLWIPTFLSACERILSTRPSEERGQRSPVPAKTTQTLCQHLLFFQTASLQFTTRWFPLLGLN